MKLVVNFIGALLVALACNGQLSARDGLARIDLTCVDDRATGFGTFQSHNQKVLANSGGIFMTHIRTRNEPYSAQQWRLSRSIDGGRTFTTLYEATNATNPPVIESDEAANLYLARPDFVDHNSYLYFFEAEKDYRNPRITPIPNCWGGKFSLAYDSPRKQLYYCTSSHSFHIVALDGAVKRSVALFQQGPHAILEYPLLFIDDQNTLHLAWTSSVPGTYLYWDIHYMKSSDGGATWQKMDGVPLATPVLVDDAGPSDRISLDDEFKVSTWLSSFFVRQGTAHFLYWAQKVPPQEHYMRYGLKTARRHVDLTPHFKGDKVEIAGLDGFFATDNDTIYCVGHTPDGYIGCLASSDNGGTWRDFALSDDKIDGLYALGGCRSVSRDGRIIGSFTTEHSTAVDADGKSKVYFFQIRTADVAAAASR